MPSTQSHSFLDAAGEACGTVTPVIRKALAALHGGQVLEVLTRDPATRLGVPAWCRLTGHELVASQEDGQGSRFWIRKKSDPSPND